MVSPTQPPQPVASLQGPWRRAPRTAFRKALSAVAVGGIAISFWVLQSVTLPDEGGTEVHSLAAQLPRAASLTDAPEQLLVETTGDGEHGRAAALEGLRHVHIASRSLSHIRRRYVEPERISAPQMFVAALQAVAHRVPEMLVRGPRDGSGSLDLRIANAHVGLDASSVVDLHRLNWKLLEALRFVAAHLPADVDASSVEYAAVNGMLATLDPYSYMLDPEQYRDMRTHTGGRFGGLGIRILTIEGVLTIVGVIEGSPAERAGLLENDQIVQIDSEDTLNMSLDDAVTRLRGKVGSPARLMIRRKGVKRLREVTVVRAVIHLKSVESKVLDTGVGYVRIKSFQRGTADELHKSLERLYRSGAKRGLVLDLRNNPGGLLDEAVKVCDLLLDGGTIVVTVEGAGQRRDERSAGGADTRRKLPVAVLINARSASASEIVAGALKHSNRAIVLGERSFGKGTVQVPFEIGAGALKLTVAKYLVPGDVSIQDVGVTPDIALQFLSARAGRTRLFDMRHRRRRKSWLKLDAPPPKPSHRLRIVLPDRRREGEQTPAQVREMEPVTRAARIIRYAGKGRADQMLTDAIPHIAEMQQADDRMLTAQLLRAGIDWRPGPRTETPKLRLSVAKPEGGFRVRAGESIAFSVTVRNDGRKPLYRVHVLTRSKDIALDGREAVVGKLAPGEQRVVKVWARPSRRHLDARVSMRVIAAQDGRLRDAEQRVLVTVIGRAPPDLRVRYWLDDTPVSDEQRAHSDGNGHLQPGEDARLRIEIENAGPGEAGSLVAALRSLSGRRLHLEEGRMQLGKLAVGGRARAVFQIRGEAATAGKHGRPLRADVGFLEVMLSLRDERYGYRRKVRMRVPWTRSGGALAQIVNSKMDARVQAVRRRNRDRFSRAPVILLGEEQRVPTAGGALHGPLQWETPAGHSCKTQLKGLARFESDDPPRRFVTVSVASTKQSYAAGHGRDEVEFVADLRLDTGLNRVTIRARAGPDLIAERKVLIECLQNVASKTTGVTP